MSEHLSDDPVVLRERLARAEAELADARAVVEAVERTGRFGVWTADMTTGDGTWSRTLYDLYYRDPALGPPGLGASGAFVHPDDQERLQASMQEMLQQAPGSVPPVAFRTHPSLGPVRTLETQATMVFTGGAPTATGVVVDVSEREGASDRLALILERLPLVVFSLDREGNITSSNRAPQSIGESYLAYCAEDSVQQMSRALERAWATGEVQLVRAEDTFGRWWESRLVGVPGPSGQLDELLGVTLDITAQHEMEKKLHEAQKLESLGVLAGGIAHDFNNLLVGIIGNADLALQEVTASSPTHESLSDILTASHRAADLCRQMLAYSGRGRFVVETTDLRSVVREMAQLLKASIAKSAVLRYDFADVTQPVEADVSQLRQVVMNLILNASDALQGAEGIISLACGSVEADAAYLSEAYHRPDLAPGTYTFLEVSDTGAGMDEATRARIFEPFFSSKAVGRGLGLAAVSGIVRGHRGAIRVYSELGKGTSIKVLLPASDTPVAQASSARPTDTDRRAMEGYVLVTDDEAAVRRVARRSLEAVGFRVLEAEDGTDAVEMYRAHGDTILAILLDMTMPQMGGEEAFRQLRQLDADVRVLLSSGYNEQEATRRFAGKGLAGFLQKPYTATALQNAVIGMVEGDLPGITRSEPER